MNSSNQTAQQQFPHSAGDVYAALTRQLPQSGFEIESSDVINHRLMAVPNSLALEWCDNLSITVSGSSSRCAVEIVIAPKPNINWLRAQRNKRILDDLFFRVRLQLEINVTHSNRRRVRGYKSGQALIDEFDDGTFDVHLNATTLHFESRAEADQFLKTMSE